MSDIALECRAASRRFGDVAAVTDVDLSVRAGEVVALVGLNGAGKTSLMRLMLGMLRPDAGSVRVLGHDVTRAAAAVWAGIGHMVETPFAYPELTARQNLWAAARLHGVPRHDAARAAEAVLERLALQQYADRRAGTLSLGNRQRVGLASALVHRPRLLVLDEPTNALDPAGVVLLRDLVQELAATGTAVVVSSHHLDEVARVSDRVAVIHRGRLLGELPPDGADLERSFFAMAYDADARAGLAPEQPAATDQEVA
jgi:ABC-2 type transport system ATP-binding protein